MKIVKFKNGKYAIRKFDFFSLHYEYLDLKHGFWWGRNYSGFKDCVGSYYSCRVNYDARTDKGTRM